MQRGVVASMNINALNLRQAIMYKMQGSDATAVADTITDAIATGQEKTLPGLGVLFEVLWQHSDQAIRQQMVQTIADHLPKQATPPV
jgi:small acid-soluble spore protein I (minor)